MEQCIDVVHKMTKGMKIRFFDNRSGQDQGVFFFNRQLDENILIVNRESDGLELPGDMRLLSVQFLECPHDWKRIKLFRTDEFHCKLCPAVRAFDIEKDEAA